MKLFCHHKSRRSSFVSGATAAGVLVSALVVAFPARAQAAGYDPAARQEIVRITNAVEFEQRDFRGSGLRGEIVPYLSPEEKARSVRRGPQLLEALRSGRFELLVPIERGDSVADLPTYLSLQSDCADQPVLQDEYNDRGGKTGVTFRRTLNWPEDLKGFRFEHPFPFPPAGERRPIDYEVSYTQGTPVFATAGFALFKDTRDSDQTRDNQLYVLRAEDFEDWDETSQPPRGLPTLPASIPGSLVVFEHPSCRYRTHIEFSNYFNNRPGIVKDGYFAEVIIIEDSLVLVVLSANRNPAKESDPRYSLFLAELNSTQGLRADRYRFVSSGVRKDAD